jgi:hypothetical protein
VCLGVRRLIWDSPNLEGQVPVFIFPRNRVAQLYPRALGSLFVAFYDSQGCRGGIPTRLHTGFNSNVEVEITIRPTVSRPVGLGVRRPSGTSDQFYFLLQIFFRQLRVCNFVAPYLTRGRVCNLLYNYFWTLSEQSLLGRSPAELTAIFYCPIWNFLNLEVMSKSKSHYDRQSVGQAVLASGAHLGPATNGGNGVGVGVVLAADSQSTSASGYRASLWDPWQDFILLFLLRLTITFFFFRRRLLWRENGSVVYSAVTHDASSHL